MKGAEFITALQMADSAFPAGVFAYSWGLETLLSDGQLGRRELETFAEAELHGRWHGVERPSLAGGWRADTLRALSDWDATVDVSMWSESQRQHSKEAGAATLIAAVRLGITGAREMRDAVRDGQLIGHLPCITGALYRGVDLSLETALLVSAQGFLRGLLSAALRLGQVGALETHAIAARLAPTVVQLAAPPALGSLPTGFSPMTDIALMRPTAARLFIN
ncbi:urease accessory protein UreF [Rhodalgimonas zhirmunskyi]|uniref:Urease accessory protein UreF n=1 Tax=Rhodalgimonas zhirmunskyi TaxID=2964767 RepID=A0AAJ1X4X7_9RHOB|nr:urease accessory UreF family protein [Rhodoalgimonas zhirmunskyi]MDQ2093589.1 urease accessory protein UreF [Rhodoalgimonas zhirmunskyi]